MSAKRKPKRAPIARQGEDREAVPAAPSAGTFAVPFVLSLALLVVSITPRVARDPAVAASLWGAALALFLWQGALLSAVKLAGAVRSLTVPYGTGR
jgi:hypothetical protein